MKGKSREAKQTLCRYLDDDELPPGVSLAGAAVAVVVVAVEGPVCWEGIGNSD